jgi:branched-chain amino acid transport system ATP-binding protein
MVRSFQISAVFGRKTARENVRMALQRPMGVSYRFWMSSAWLGRLDAQADALLDQVGLAESADTPASELSYGRKRALEIATTLALEPELLMLDEPMAGLGQEDIVRITDLIRTVSRSRTVLMVEHNLSVVETLSDTITVLMHGQQLAAGTYAQIAANPAVVEAYMGTGHG